MRASPRLLLVAAAAGALVAAFSCKTFDLPSETCDPSHFHGGMLSGAATDSVCDRCLETNCCEQVGVCERSTNCTEVVSSVHTCVIDAGLAGAHDETKCADGNMLKSTQGAEDAYRCMRDSCGIQCGLPVCKVDPAALLIQTPSCDACFASSCCSQLNGCYASRACKLTLECIIKECGSELGASLSGPTFQIPDGGGDAAAFDICADAGDPNGSNAPACVSKCLCDFKDNDQGLTPSNDAQRPPMLALAVYTCGQQAGCGAPCTAPADASTDAASDGDAR
jgi:hypothetical protein